MRVWFIVATVLHLGALPLVALFAAFSAFLYDDPNAGGFMLDSLFWVWITLPLSFLLGGGLHWAAYSIWHRRRTALALSFVPEAHAALWVAWVGVYAMAG